MSSQPNVQFPVQRWQDDRTIYTVAVKTSDLFNAGTDSNVYVQLIGQKTKSEELELKSSVNHGNKFERNHSDVFVFPNIPQLGDIENVKIWHDNTGPNPAWHLEVVDVHDVSTNMIYKFPCGRWLSKSEDDGALSRILNCIGKREHTPKNYRFAQQESSSQNQTNQIGQNPQMPQMMDPQIPQFPPMMFPYAFPNPNAQGPRPPPPFPTQFQPPPAFLLPPMSSTVPQLLVNDQQQVGQFQQPQTYQRNEPIQSGK